AEWKHSHNYMHHTYTNIVGKDRDVGYGLLRMAEEEPWKLRNLGNPVYALALAFLFEWGVALHDLEIEGLETGKRSPKQVLEGLAHVLTKARGQLTKDYVLYPLLAGPVFPLVFAGNAAANVI